MQNVGLSFSLRKNCIVQTALLNFVFGLCGISSLFDVFEDACHVFPHFEVIVVLFLITKEQIRREIGLFEFEILDLVHPAYRRQLCAVIGFVDEPCSPEVIHSERVDTNHFAYTAIHQENCTRTSNNRCS